MVTDFTKEVIFVGLPGPTHHYGGLSPDNVASSSNRGSISNPKQAALQVLAMVKEMKALGAEVAFLPPQLRPHMDALRPKFSGSDEQIIAQAAQKDPELLHQLSSSSAMWTANAATVAPSIDAADEKLHITVANLHTNLHRRIEAEDTYKIFKAIFHAVPHCEVHAPLATSFLDEGAANHMRLSSTHHAQGLHVFAYGTEEAAPTGNGRQSLSASKALAHQHRIPDGQAVFVQQNPEAIAKGVFHNDVIAVSNEHVLLVHEKAYAGGTADIERIAQAYRGLHADRPLTIIAIGEDEMAIDEAVRTYFFNSQIISRVDGGMTIIAPAEVQMLYDGKLAMLMENIRADVTNPIDEVQYVDLHQSMRNGGGPACLRLRVPMSTQQMLAVRSDVNVFADEALLSALVRVIETHYPEELSPAELGDPKLYDKCKAMLSELSDLMRLPLL